MNNNNYTFVETQKKSKEGMNDSLSKEESEIFTARRSS